MDDIETIVENSYKDFHVKGFDYICLRRTPERTVKLYFFEGDVAKAPEVVNPHNHRYNFDTEVLHGGVSNSIFVPEGTETPGWGDWGPAVEYEHFGYATPLLHKFDLSQPAVAHFKWLGTVRLTERFRAHYTSSPYSDDGRHYSMRYKQIHTIRITAPQTVLKLIQHKDEIPIELRSSTFTRDKEPPSLSGLYNKFTPDEIIKRLTLLKIRELMK